MIPALFCNPRKFWQLGSSKRSLLGWGVTLQKQNPIIADTGGGLQEIICMVTYILVVIYGDSESFVELSHKHPSYEIL